MGRFAAPHQAYEPTQAAPRPSNGLGVAGFVVSLVGLVACPLIAPVGAIMSLVAMFREPRGFAIAGFVTGLIGSIWFLVALLFFGVAILIVGEAFMAHGIQGVEATGEMLDLGQKVLEHRKDTGSLPDSVDQLSGLGADELADPWQRPYVYTRSDDGATFELKSAGPDGQPGTGDDIVLDQQWLTGP